MKTVLESSLDNAATVTTPSVGLGGEISGLAFARGDSTLATDKGVSSQNKLRFCRFPAEFLKEKAGVLTCRVRLTNLSVNVDSTPKTIISLEDSNKKLFSIYVSSTQKQSWIFDLLQPSGVTNRVVVDTVFDTKWHTLKLEWTSAKTLVVTFDVTKLVTLQGFDPALQLTDAKLYLGSSGFRSAVLADAVFDDLKVEIDDAVVVPVPTPEPEPPVVVEPPVTPPPTPEPTPEPVTGQFIGKLVKLSETPATVSKTTLPVPAVGAIVTDTTFDSRFKMQRLSDVGGPTYSQLQSFSQDEKWMLQVVGGVGYRVIDANTGAVNALVSANADWKSAVAPRWFKNKVYFFHSEPNPCKVYEIDPVTGVSRRVWSSPANLPHYIGSRVEEQISENGLMAVWSHNAQTNHTLSVVDLNTGTTKLSLAVASLPLGNDMNPLNWVAVSPLGKYLCLAWSRDGGGRSSGMELFDINTGAFVRQIYQGHQHGDMCVLSDGREAYFSVALYTSDPALHMFDGSGVKVLRTMPWGCFGHASCRGPNGWALVSGYALGNGPYLGRDELFLMKLDGPDAGDVLRLCHHRSNTSWGDVNQNYFSQPKATLSPSGRFMVWNDNFGAAQMPFTMKAQIKF
jgi:hypothetical protein